VTDSRLETRIAAVRRFNRFYTRQIGVLQEGLLQSELSLTEVRVLYELAHGDRSTATDIGRTLGIDAGYLSRMLRRLEERGWVQRRQSDEDARQAMLSLTRKGRGLFAKLDARAHDEIAALLEGRSLGAQRRLVAAMGTIEQVLGDEATERPEVILRAPRPGDMGWVVDRHGTLYAEEYGWGERFEALVAHIVAEYMREHDEARERCWIAEADGVRVGSIFLVRHTDDVARLRLLLVEPEARGLGVGRRLVEECLQFARHAGYRKVTLWTNAVLVAARAIYVANGFRLVREEPHRHFGVEELGQDWELEL
jgi:DNA-binding MarR family transcriptional regulator/GNAT superfamily N-acetyltransferase